MEKKLKRGIIAVFLANIINLGFSLATSFLLPKYLSVDSYAAIKTFQLYVSYVGLLHFGYIDGVYLKYGGVELGHTLGADFTITLSTMRVFQTAVTALILITSIIANDLIFVSSAMAVLPLNMNNYYKFLYQATGEFKKYGRTLNITTISTFVLNMLLLFFVKTDNYMIFITMYVALDFAIWAYLEIDFRKKHSLAKGKWFSFIELYENVKTGILLTIGNLASMFLTSMDRWFVKILMTTLDFAQYSFAVSVENFLNVAVTPITTTLYNFFCTENDTEKRRNVFYYILAFATILPSLAFPAKWIVNLILPKYTGSTKVVFLLFASQMFYIIIKSVFVNLYKVQRKQKRYFIKLALVLAVGFILNIVFYRSLHIKESFAIGTLLSSIFWFAISVIDFGELEITASAWIYLVLEVIAFLLFGLMENPIIGFCLYISFSFLSMMIFIRSTLVGICRSVKNIFRGRRI